MGRGKKKKRLKRKGQEGRKHQRKSKGYMSDLLNRDPFLRMALNHNHPLVSCLINENWQEAGMANIFVFREAPSGLVMASFLVDLLGFGLKDAFGNYALTRAEMESTKSTCASHGLHLIHSDLSLVNTIVYGAIAWTKKWGFSLPNNYKVWLKLLDPVESVQIDMSLFGQEGEPLLIVAENLDDYEDFDDEEDGFKQPLSVEIEDDDIDLEVFKLNLEIDQEVPSQETLTRVRDLKRALIKYSNRFEFEEEIFTAMENRFEQRVGDISREEEIGFLDAFILQEKLEDGQTILVHFVEDYREEMSAEVRALVEDWGGFIEGLFEILAKDGCRFSMKNLINKRDYVVYPTDLEVETEFVLKPGDFILARILPAKGFHIFSGITVKLPFDGSERQRKNIYKMALEIQLNNPWLTFSDNDEKL